MSKQAQLSTPPPGKIEDTDDAWDPSGPLGHDEAHVQGAGEDFSKTIDESLGLHPISIRLQKALIDDLKAIGQLNRLGYQPLIRQILTRFVECEKRNMAKNLRVPPAPAEHVPPEAPVPAAEEWKHAA